MQKLTITILFVAAVVGCSSEKPALSAVWTVVPETALTQSQNRQKAIALAAREALFERLMARLTEVVQARGPAAAIEICQSEAPILAETVGREKGVRIGRTSDKLRNTKNQPPDWAVAPLANRPTEPVFLVGPDGQFGAILPIRLKAQCLTCHGPMETIPAPVREALANRYPQDRAVGYAEGDLRGWFWVEAAKDLPETEGK
jgi:hypothetical protein